MGVQREWGDEMKQMDKRNLKILLGLIPEGEIVTARQALDLLVEYKINNGGNMNYIPTASRLSTVLRTSQHFHRIPPDARKGHVRFMRAY